MRIDYDLDDGDVLYFKSLATAKVLDALKMAVNGTDTAWNSSQLIASDIVDLVIGKLVLWTEAKNKENAEEQKAMYGEVE